MAHKNYYDILGALLCLSLDEITAAKKCTGKEISSRMLI